jgi:hypothetical protein
VPGEGLSPFLTEPSPKRKRGNDLPPSLARRASVSGNRVRYNRTPRCGGEKKGLAPENLTWSDLRRDNKESPGSGLRQIMSGNLAIRGSYARQSVGIRPSAVWRRQLHRTRHVRFSGLRAKTAKTLENKQSRRCLSRFSASWTRVTGLLKKGTGSTSCCIFASVRPLSLVVPVPFFSRPGRGVPVPFFSSF